MDYLAGTGLRAGQRRSQAFLELGLVESAVLVLVPLYRPLCKCGSQLVAGEGGVVVGVGRLEEVPRDAATCASAAPGGAVAVAASGGRWRGGKQIVQAVGERLLRKLGGVV